MRDTRITESMEARLYRRNGSIKRLVLPQNSTEGLAGLKVDSADVSPGFLGSGTTEAALEKLHRKTTGNCMGISVICIF